MGEISTLSTVTNLVAEEADLLLSLASIKAAIEN
jgi:hypothetical protein